MAARYDSYLSDLHNLGEILSEASQLNLAGVPQSYNTDNMNISDVDEANSESSESSDSTVTQFDNLDTKAIRFAYIANEDIVELSAVGDDFVVWVRGTKSDAVYKSILSEINKRVKNAGDTIRFLDKGEVILIKYSGDYSRGIVNETFHSERDAEISVVLIDIGVSLNINPGK